MTAAAPRKPSPADEWRSRILYKDDRLLIIDKPAGLPVHGGPRGGPNLEALLPLLADHPKHVPMLAHRLDTDTSGCLILAKKRSALRKLHELFAAGSIGKTSGPLSMASRRRPLERSTLPSRRSVTSAAGA